MDTSHLALGTAIHPPDPNVFLFTDASHYGWSRPLAQLDARPTGDQEVAGSTPAEVGNILLWRFEHEIFSMVILSHPLIQEGQLSVSGERILVNRLED